MIKRVQCNLTALFICLGTLSAGFAQPRITQPPVSQSVSLGANVINQVLASGTAPLFYQWRFNEVEITGATGRTLILTNAQLASAGGYSVVVTNVSGSVTSQVATLDVDPAFTMITSGPIVTDSGPSVSAAWGD